MDLQTCADTLETALTDLRNGTGDPLVAIEDVAKSLLEQTYIWALCINHRHGDDLYVFSSLRAANVALVEYVDEWWDGEIGDEILRPDDADERVAAYFDFVQGGEYYTLTSTVITVEKREIVTEAPEIDD